MVSTIATNWSQINGTQRDVFLSAMLRILQALISDKALIRHCEILLLWLHYGPLSFYREDCFHISTLLPSNEVTGDGLESIFQAFAAKRQPRTAELVRGARFQGSKRVVVDGPAACKERDQLVSKIWLNEEDVAARMDAMFCEPF